MYIGTIFHMKSLKL